MPADDYEVELKLSVADIVGRGGPVAGSAGAALGGLVVLLAFFMPWVSCATLSLSALDVARGQVPAEATAGSSGLLYLLPALALITMAVSAATVLLAVWSRIPRLTAVAAAVGLLLTSAWMIVPHVVFYLRYQGVRSGEGAFALTSLIRLEEGFWLSAAGVVLSMLSAVLAILTGGVGLLLSKRESPARSEEGDG